MSARTTMQPETFLCTRKKIALSKFLGVMAIFGPMALRVGIVGLSATHAGLDAAVSHLRTLGYRMQTFAMRTYTDALGVWAVARGQQHPMRAWILEQTSEQGGVVVEERRAIPVPYLDWGAMRIESTQQVHEVLITDKLLLRVFDSHVEAELQLDGQGALDRHLTALKSVVVSSGFDNADKSCEVLLARGGGGPVK